MILCPTRRDRPSPPEEATLTLIPIASFLAGALLSLLLPTLLLIALTVWYMLFLRRAPDPALNPARTDAEIAPAAADLPDEAGVVDGTAGGGHPAPQA